MNVTTNRHVRSQSWRAKTMTIGSSVLGRPALSDDPATETGVDPHGGDHADATSDGGPDVPEGVEPDLKDAASGPRQVDVESARRARPEG